MPSSSMLLNEVGGSGTNSAGSPAARTRAGFERVEIRGQPDLAGMARVTPRPW
jgi:hypothetical protein